MKVIQETDLMGSLMWDCNTHYSMNSDPILDYVLYM